MIEMLQALGWSDIVGLIGSLLVATIYSLLTFEKISVQSYTHFILNIVAACLLGTSLMFNFNPGSMLIELFWFVVSIIGMIRLYIQRKRDVRSKLES